MDVTSRCPHLAGVLLLIAAPFAAAEGPLPLPDPVAPAVVGRPLAQIRPARPVQPKPAAARPVRREQLAAATKPVRTPPPAQVALAPAAAPVLVQPAPVTRRVPVPVRRGPAAFSSNDHALVSRYYDGHPASAAVPQWKRGEPIPPKAALTGVPDDLRGALSPLPAGHQYVEVDGEVVLVAVQSRVVVDGISRSMR